MIKIYEEVNDGLDYKKFKNDDDSYLDVIHPRVLIDVRPKSSGFNSCLGIKINSNTSSCAFILLKSSILHSKNISMVCTSNPEYS